MGWVWKDDDNDGKTNTDISAFRQSNNGIQDDEYGFSTRKIVNSNCRTEEVEPGKFVRKCEKTEQILRDCVGKPTQVVQSNKEYTEEDVTNEMTKGSSYVHEPSDIQPFGFPGLRSDIESIERNIFGGLSRFFEAAEELGNGFRRVFDDPRFFEDSSPPRRQGVPIEGYTEKGPSPNPKNSDSGELDISGLARDV